jgi:hypothetical protein
MKWQPFTHKSQPTSPIECPNPIIRKVSDKHLLPADSFHYSPSVGLWLPVYPFSFEMGLEWLDESYTSQIPQSILDLSLEEVIVKMNNPDVTLKRYQFFKEYLGKEFPDLSLQDILLIHNHRELLRAISGWSQSDKLMQLLEIELCKQETQLK